VAENARVVVVGSGPPGAAAAVFLSRAGIDVLLLEAGPERLASGLNVRFSGFTVLKRRRALRERADFASTGDPATRLYEDLAPGGLTNHWSCAVPRFSAEDFADAERAGEAYVWPIGYDDLAPWYERVEPLLHVAGAGHSFPHVPAANVRRTWALGSDWGSVAAEAPGVGRAIGPMPYAYGADSTVTFSGTPFNSFVRLVRPELRAGHIEVRFDARVTRLEWAPGRRRVDTVVIRDARTGSESRIPCRAVVLAAGAINTAEILLTSSSADFPEGLGNTHGVLGRYLHDHPLGKLVIDLDRSISVHPPSYLTRSTLDRSQPLYAAACVQWSGVDVVGRSLLSGSPGRLSWVGFNVFGTMAPIRESRVSLASPHNGSPEPRGVVLHVNHPPEARTTLDRARDDMVEILRGAGLTPRVRIWHVEPPGEAKHFGGTCRMHSSPAFGMVDQWNRLHAVPNVMAVDSSAFTTGPEKNPVLTAMAIAARAGRRLAEELKAGDL
jgi:choline dehydrogenase-like flavoprotein